MANTYTQLYVHVVFAVKGRQPLIPQQHKAELHQYITGILTHQKQKVIQINSMPDHLHFLIGMSPDARLSELVRDVKQHSTRFINRKQWVVGKFQWQRGYSAFTYSHSHMPGVARYIENQERHHHEKTFQEEYLELLDKFGVDYDERYVFDPRVDDAPKT